MLFRGAALDLRGISLRTGTFWADGVVSGTTVVVVEEGDEEPVNSTDDCIMQGRLKNSVIE